MADEKKHGNSFSVNFAPATAELVATVPKFLRSQYIAEAVEMRIKAEGAPKYTEAQAKAAGAAVAVKRAMSILASAGVPVPTREEAKKGSKK